MVEDSKKVLDDTVTALWQGKTIDMELLRKTIDQTVNEIVEGVDEMRIRGVTFPMEYVVNAMKHLSECIASRDDYRLADCICYEWLEIIGVYDEVMMKIG